LFGAKGIYSFLGWVEGSIFHMENMDKINAAEQGRWDAHILKFSQVRQTS